MECGDLVDVNGSLRSEKCSMGKNGFFGSFHLLELLAAVWAFVGVPV
jgi:hypothetical protein